MSDGKWEEVNVNSGDILYELPELTNELGFVVTLASCQEAKVFAEANHLTLIKEAKFLGAPNRLDYTGSEWIYTCDGWRKVSPYPSFSKLH